LQLARALSGVASGGHFVRPHVAFADQLPDDFRKAMLDSFPGSGQTSIPLSPENWQLITDGMFAVTQAGGTAGASHLEGVDFAGKTGTAQTASHDAISRMGSGHNTIPNAWFVGMVPRRNPEIVVAVLWENGNWGANSAHLAAEVIQTYVNKQRRQQHNVMDQAAKPAETKPVQVGAIWSTPDPHHPELAKAGMGHFLLNPALSPALVLAKGRD
jgi:penicillin-binding protein 2